MRKKTAENDLGIKLINKLYRSKIFERIFHALIYCLKEELKDCYSVLDLGCGANSPIQFCGVPYRVGVDAYLPSLRSSKRNGIHSKYIHKILMDIKFKDKEFDAVIMIDVLEHLEKNDGKILLQKAEKWSKKKVIITTPNDYLPQKIVDNNIYQAHLSGWSVAEMKTMGYEIKGLAGWKFFRNNDLLENEANNRNFLSSIRFRPRWLFFVFAVLSQLVTYQFPNSSSGIFCVKRLE